MKKSIFALAAAAALMAGGVLLAQPKNDRDVVDNTVEVMDEQELAPAARPEPMQGPAELTPRKVRQIVEALKDPEAHNGLLGIAHEFDCSLRQVKMIKRAVARRLRKLHASELEPVDGGIR